jgi:hypothetical protein
VEHFYQSIEGWMGYEDTYQEAVRITPDGGTIVEVGSFLGRSAAFMAVEIANSGKKIRFVCVDQFTGHLGAGLFDGRCSIPTFHANMKRGGVSHLIEAMEMLSVDASKAFADASVDFVFIDAAHDYNNVRADICAWLPKVKPGGVIAGHDYGSGWPMVRVAVQETLSWRNVKERKDCVFWYENVVHDFGHWVSKPADDADYLCHIPYVNRPDLLKIAVESLNAEERRHTYIIDQSKDGFDSSGLGVGHYRATRKVPFSQMMNFSLDVCRLSGKAYSIFMHNDARCEATSLTRLVERARKEDPSGWGTLFTKDSLSGGVYDYLAAFNMRAIREVGKWDESFSWYVSEIDLYRRFKLHGRQLIGCPDIVVSHAGSQTIAADSAIRSEATAQQEWAHSHYRHKWGGGVGEEAYSIPYDGKP